MKNMPTEEEYRKCGDCKECCTVVGVTEIEKPSDTPCPNICRKGCSIYKDRPESCRAFQCLWTQGLGSHKHRPDKSGVVGWVEDETNFGTAIILSESRKNAFDRHEGRELVHDAVKIGFPVLCRIGTEGRSYRIYNVDDSQISDVLKK